MTPVDLIDYSGSVNSGYTLPEISQKTIDKDGFYKLLLAEIQHQDPTAPLDNKDMILQLAQFSAIESTQSLNNNMSSFIAKTSLATATSLLGKDVIYLDPRTSSNYYGTVSAVQKTATGYSVIIDGQAVELDMVRMVAPGTAPATESGDTEV